MMPVSVSNIFSNIPGAVAEEVTESILETGTFRIERIVSHGQTSPGDFWYDQEADEWVMVLRGKARLLMEGDRMPLELEPGGYINIPAHRKHRVEWTDPDYETVWLAVHYNVTEEAKS